MFSYEQIARLRAGLNEYRVRSGRPSMQDWDKVKNDLLISPATFGLKSGVGGLSVNELARFAAGEDMLTNGTLTNLKSFLLHERILPSPLWAEE